MFWSTISQKKERKKTQEDTSLLYLWFSLWWCPVDIWEKKRTSSSSLRSTGCFSSGNLSEEKRRRAAWEPGAPFRTLPLLTCSFSDRWQAKKKKKQSLSPSWGSHHLRDIAVSACPAVSMFSSLSGERPVLSGESSPSHSRKQVLFFLLNQHSCFFPKPHS